MTMLLTRSFSRPTEKDLKDLERKKKGAVPAPSNGEEMDED